MGAIAVLGTQWGDEGKGRIVDYLSAQADLIVRFSGGNNAGHTVIHQDQKILFTILPAGSLSGKKLAIAAGVCFDPEVLLSEIKMIEKLGVKIKLAIDPRTHLVMPYHRQRDVANEAKRGKNKVGSVGFGIGYSFIDRTRRGGLRFEDLISPRELKNKLAYQYPRNKETLSRLYGVKIIPQEEIFKKLKFLGQKLSSYLEDVSLLVIKALKEKKSVLFEGSQGFLLDNNFGTYPFTTGCPTIAGYIFSSVGLPPQKIKTIGIVKAFNSRAGSGPFPTEISIQKGAGKHILVKGHEFEEFPNVPVRPRRIGWLDLPLLRYAQQVNNFSALAITHLDTLAELKEIRVCTHYQYPKQKSLLPIFPGMTNRAKPVLKTVKSWPEIKAKRIKKFSDLPIGAREYLALIEKEVKVPIKYISLGAERRAILKR